MNLSPRQQELFRYIARYTAVHGALPRVSEIQRHFGLKSAYTVRRLLSELAALGCLASFQPWESQAQFPGRNPEPLMWIPLLGVVAAGRPIEVVQDPQTTPVPMNMAGSDQLFALRVKGDSMIEDCIYENDVIIVKPTSQAENGQTVVALLDGREATVKRFYRDSDTVRLVAANPAYPPLVISPSDRVQVQGIVVGLIRKIVGKQREQNRIEPEFLVM